MSLHTIVTGLALFACLVIATMTQAGGISSIGDPHPAHTAASLIR